MAGARPDDTQSLAAPAIPPQSDPPAANARGIDQNIESEQITHLFGGSALSLLVEPLAAALLGLGLLRQVASEWTALWVVAIWGLAAARAILWHRYRTVAPAPGAVAGWHSLLVGSVALAGVLWGVGFAFLWPAESSYHQMFLGLVVASVAATMAGFLSSHMSGVIAFLATLLAVVLAGIARHWGDQGYLLMAAFAAPYGLVLFGVARYINRLLVDSLRLRFQLAAAREAAEAASRAKSEFIANISHELRTPLNAIIGFSEMMKEQMLGPSSDRYMQYARDIHQSGTHLLAIINDILDLSKIEAGKMELVPEELDLAEVVNDALNIVRENAERSGLTLETRVPAPAPRLRGDGRIVRQILLNLLSNAIKFTPIGGRVAVEVRREAGGNVVLTVQDTGIGIAEKDIPKVLEPFGQVESAYTRQYQGTGLGLPLVRSMVELLGGRFDLQSTVGTGTTASIDFPKGVAN